MCILYYCTTPAPPTPTNVTIRLKNTSSVRVAWQWTSSGPAPDCFNTTTVTYRPEGGGESSLQLSDRAATEATLTELQNNTCYTITVVATAGEHRREGECNISSSTRYVEAYSWRPVFIVTTWYLSCIGPQHLSAAVLSPTSVHLTLAVPCHTQQYHIYYRGTCGAYIDEDSLDTDHQEHTFDRLQEGVNYSFTVTQSGFSGGRVLSSRPVYARTFTAGLKIASHINSVINV